MLEEGARAQNLEGGRDGRKGGDFEILKRIEEGPGGLHE
jgi:hypothetical protein